MKKDLEETIKVLQDTWENLKNQEFGSEDYWKSWQSIDNLMWRIEEAKNKLQTYYDETTISMDWVQAEIEQETDREVRRIVENYFNEPITELATYSEQLQEIRGKHTDVIDVIDVIGKTCSLIGKLETEVKWRTAI